MNKENVLNFLAENPDFLAEHAEILGVRLRDDKVRSFAQAQLAAAQIKADKMAAQMTQMMAAAEANHATMQRVLALDIALLRANTAAQAVQALYRSLEQDFGLQQYRLVLVAEPHNKAKIPPALCVADERAKAEIAAMGAPVLGSKISPALRALLPAGSHVAESFLQLPVPIGGATGALLLAADEDVARFGEDLPTECSSLVARSPCWPLMACTRVCVRRAPSRVLTPVPSRWCLSNLHRRRRVRPLMTPAAVPVFCRWT